MHFLGKNPKRDSESKNRFFVSLAKSKKEIMNPMNPYAININGLIRIRILRIHDFCVSLGKNVSYIKNTTVDSYSYSIVNNYLPKWR